MPKAGPANAAKPAAGPQAANCKPGIQSAAATALAEHAELSQASKHKAHGFIKQKSMKSQ